jgi:uncharacterized protein
MADDPVPRLASDRPLPPYAYVPGLFPHPVRDPAGHSHGVPHPAPPPVDPARWWESPDYLFGIDLFNFGFYWEAHEAWEGLWHAAGRSGEVADFLKGLIQMTAAGVKVRQGVPAGVVSLAAGAGALFRRAGRRRLLGLDVAELVEFVDDLAARPPSRPAKPVERVLPLLLRPERGGP